MFKRFLTIKLVLLLALNVLSYPYPQGSQKGKQHGTTSTPAPPTTVSSTTPTPAPTATATPNPTGLKKGKSKDWRRGDPTLLNNLYRSKTPLGNAEVYIILALVIGFATVVIGCWLSDNCWSPEPEEAVTIA